MSDSQRAQIADYWRRIQELEAERDALRKSLAKAWADKAMILAREARLQEALAPFAEFAKAPTFDKLPDGTPMTQGSPMARRQVTAGDFKRAIAALAPAAETPDADA